MTGAVLSTGNTVMQQITNVSSAFPSKVSQSGLAAQLVGASSCTPKRLQVHSPVRAHVYVADLIPSRSVHRRQLIHVSHSGVSHSLFLHPPHLPSSHSKINKYPRVKLKKGRYSKFTSMSTAPPSSPWFSPVLLVLSHPSVNLQHFLCRPCEYCNRSSPGFSAPPHRSPTRATLVTIVEPSGTYEPTHRGFWKGSLFIIEFSE